MEKTFNWTVTTEYTFDDDAFDFICEQFELQLDTYRGRKQTNAENWQEVLDDFFLEGDFEFNPAYIPDNIRKEMLSEAQSYYINIWKPRKEKEEEEKRKRIEEKERIQKEAFETYMSQLRKLNLIDESEIESIKSYTRTRKTTVNAFTIYPDRVQVRYADGYIQSIFYKKK